MGQGIAGGPIGRFKHGVTLPGPRSCLTSSDAVRRRVRSHDRLVTCH